MSGNGGPVTRKPKLVLVGSGRNVYREYIFDALSAEVDLRLLDDRPTGWRGRYVEDHVVSDLTFDRAVEALHEEWARGRVDGIMTFEEQSVELAASLTRHFDLPGPTPEAVHRARDKHRMRSVWNTAGVRSARSELVASGQEAVRAAEELGYPVVVKPRSLAASAGVSLAKGPEEVADSYARAAGARLTRYAVEEGAGVLVEEYLEGPEYSVEAVVSGTELVPLAVTEKVTGPLPLFEEKAHVVGPVEQWHRPMVEVVDSAVRALGLRDTVVHAEVRLTPSGPAMIELGARIAGDMIGYLVDRATGTSISRLNARVALGDQVSATETGPAGQDRRYAGVEFVYAPAAGKLRGFELAEEHSTRPWVDRVVRALDPGTEVAAPEQGGVGSRIGYVVVTGWSPEQVRARLREVSEAVEVLVD
ncbi:ATP-grasp domain-containing protein [Actinopolyspora mortivallis]|uniref:ATP-grasp domain-containing protein n=1 Tax=Actinopolyspora mortivallis TaxID=33906 RepID=UPI00037A2877|nr:ATP-grasp domain-containing protein [Actinopolyspora mortivallis]